MKLFLVSTDYRTYIVKAHNAQSAKDQVFKSEINDDLVTETWEDDYVVRQLFLQSVESEGIVFEGYTDEY